MKRRYLSLFILLALSISLLVTVASAEDQSVSVAGASGYSIRFTQEDFLQSLALPDEELRGIVITSLPASGTLTYGGRGLLQGEAVTTATLSELAYIPASNEDTDQQFEILPVYAGGVSERSVTVSLSLRKQDNHPPVAEPVEIKTYKNIAVTGHFVAADPEGDAMTYRIASKPKRGEIAITDDGKFVYTPFKNKTGKDSVSYVAIDAYGNTSEEAEISIVIEKPDSKTTYADMDGHEAQYAATRLISEGIFVGEQINGAYYFNPDKTVSRGEFISMVCKAVGLEVDLSVGTTGFYDDADTPAWVKPYAQKALMTGLVSGSQDAVGRKYLMAADEATFTQAAVILNKALGSADVSAPVSEDVPVWAAQAVSNLSAIGVVRGADKSWNDALTRADAAQLLCKTIDAYNASVEEGGLLSWVFGW